jgi:hypothetical protein
MCWCRWGCWELARTMETKSSRVRGPQDRPHRTSGRAEEEIQRTPVEVGSSGRPRTRKSDHRRKCYGRKFDDDRPHGKRGLSSFAHRQRGCLYRWGYENEMKVASRRGGIRTSKEACPVRPRGRTWCRRWYLAARTIEKRRSKLERERNK